MNNTIKQVTVQVSIPKHWISGDWNHDIILTIKGEVLVYDGKHTPVVKQITCSGYQMWLIDSKHYFDIVALMDREILDAYANMKLNEADNNLMDYAE